MKAIRVKQFGGPEVLRLDEVPTPAPAAGEVLIRLEAAGVNPVDAYIRSGTYAAKPPLPYTPGKDGAGTVVDAPEVAGLKPGDRVYIAGSLTGTYAEFALCSGAQAHPLPDRLTFAQGAAIGVPYATAFRALFDRAKVQAGETVLVHGASGGVGLAAVQLAVANGLRVLGTSGTTRGRALVLEQGAHAAFPHLTSHGSEELLAATDGQGADVILEMLANTNLGADLRMLKRGGRVVVVGSRGSVEIDPRDAMAREADIRGMLLMNATPAELAAIHAALGRGFADGTLRPVVGPEFPLADASRAHEAVLAGGAHGKIVLRP